MPRSRNPNRKKAYEIYRSNKGKITNREIAKILGEDERVIAVWKNRDCWNDVQQSQESCTTIKKGAPYGNQNAKGHGGTGPLGNKNALKTGEFETIFFNSLNSEEQDIVSNIEFDKQKLLFQEIQLLTVREYRMLQRIQEDKKNFEKMYSIEDALTRVQEKKHRAIEALHKFGYDDARLELETLKFEAALLKQDNFSEEKEDDGFLEAMNQIASDIWSESGDDEFESK